MNLEQCITKYLEKKKFKYNGDKKPFLDEAKNFKTQVYNEIKEKCKSTFVTYENVKGLFEVYKENEDIPKKIEFKTFSSKEIKQREKIHKKAVEVFSTYASEFATRMKIFGSLTVGILNEKGEEKDFNRTTQTVFECLPSTQEEMVDLVTRLKKLDEVDPVSKKTNREYVKDYIMAGIENAKKELSELTIQPSDEKLLKYVEKNPTMFNLLLDLDAEKIKALNNDLNLGLPKEWEDDWINTYGKFCNSVGNWRIHIGAMANPLYPKLDIVDATVLYNQITGGELNDYFADYGVQHDPLNKNIINPLHQYASSGYCLEGYKFCQQSEVAEPYVGTRNNISNSIQLKLFSQKMSIDLSKYKFLNENKEEVEMKDALVEIGSGKKFVLLDNKDNYIMDLKTEVYRTYNSLCSTSKYSELDFENIINKYQDHNQKNKDKLTKDCDKELKSKLKDIYKSVSKQNPWYIKNKGNQLYTKAQEQLKKVMDSKLSNRGDVIDNLLYTKSLADQYLSSKFKTENRKSDKHSLAREEEMRQLSQTIDEMIKPIRDLSDYEQNFLKQNNLNKESTIESKQQIVIEDKAFNNEISNEIVNDDIIINIQPEKDIINKE